MKCHTCIVVWAEHGIKIFYLTQTGAACSVWHAGLLSSVLCGVLTAYGLEKYNREPMTGRSALQTPGPAQNFD